MALTPIPGGFYLPEYNIGPGSPGATALPNGGLNAASIVRIAFVFQVPKSGTLDKAEVLVGAVSSPSDVKISFQNVDGSGNPDGTADQYRVASGVSIGWLVPGLMTSDGTDSGAKRVVTQGEFLAVVYEWNSTQSGSVGFYGWNNNSNNFLTYWPYYLSHNGTSYTKRSGAANMSIALKYDDGTYANPGDLGMPFTSIASTTYASSSTPDERALYFSFPMPVTIDGGWVQVLFTSGTPFDIVLYAADGTSVLTSLSWDVDYAQSLSAHPHFFRFTSPINLAANTSYRLAIKPTTTSVNLVVYDHTVNTAAIFGAVSGGTAFHLSTRSDAGSWSETTTSRPMMGVHVTAIDAVEEAEDPEAPTVTEVPGGFYHPQYNIVKGLPDVSFYASGYLTGTTRVRVAWVIQVPKTGTLDKFELMCNFVSSPSPVKFSFQNVDGSGIPDGTVDQYRVRSGITAVWTVPGLITSDGTDGGSKRAVTKGEMLACVTEWDSATTGEVDWAGLTNNSNSETNFFPYLLSHNGSSYTKQTPNAYPSLALKYDDGTYETPVGVCYPLQSITTSQFSNADTPDERALYFSFSAAVTVDGGWFHIDLNANIEIVLYDSDGTTALATLAIDADHVMAATPAPRYFTFDAPVTLLPDTNYRLAVKPTTSTFVAIYEMSFATAAIHDALPGGSAFCLSTRTDAGAWTETTTKRPFAGLHITALEGAAAEEEEEYVGSGNSLITFIATDYAPPASNYATPDRRNAHPVLDFDDTTAESAIFAGVLPRHYSGGGITAIVCWTATSGSSSTCTWQLAFERDDTALDADGDSFASAVTGHSAVPATVGAFAYLEIPLTDAQLDGLVVGEHFRLKITRGVGGGTMSGDAELHSIELIET